MGTRLRGYRYLLLPLKLRVSGSTHCSFLMSTQKMRRADTDADGQFSITDIPQGSVYFGVLPYNIDKRLPNDFEEIVDNWVSRDWRKITQADIDAFVAKGFGMIHSDFEPDVEILSLRVQEHNFLFQIRFRSDRVRC